MADMAFFLRFRCVFDLPVAPYRHRAASEWQSSCHRSDGGDSRRPGVDATVPDFAAYGEKGGGCRALTTASWRLGGLGADEVVAAFFGDDAHGGLLVVQRIGGDEGVFESDLRIS